MHLFSMCNEHKVFKKIISNVFFFDGPTCIRVLQVSQKKKKLNVNTNIYLQIDNYTLHKT